MNCYQCQTECLQDYLSPSYQVLMPHLLWIQVAGKTSQTLNNSKIKQYNLQLVSRGGMVQNNYAQADVYARTHSAARKNNSTSHCTIDPINQSKTTMPTRSHTRRIPATFRTNNSQFYYSFLARTSHYLKGEQTVFYSGNSALTAIVKTI